MRITHDSTPVFVPKNLTALHKLHSHLSSLHKCRQRQSMWPYIILHSEAFLWNDWNKRDVNVQIVGRS